MMLQKIQLLAVVLGLLSNVASAHRLQVLVQDGEQLVTFDDEGRVEWQMPFLAPRGLKVLPNGNVMCLRGSHEVVEIACETSSVVWSFDSNRVAPNAKIDSFQLADNGRTLLALRLPPSIVEVDRLGTVHKTFPLPASAGATPGDIRFASVLPSGNWLICDQRDSHVRELDPASGEVVWDYALPNFPDAMGTCVDALRLPNGDTVVSTGVGGSLLVVSSSGKLASAITAKELDLGSPFYPMGLQRVGNGNYVIACGPTDEQGPCLMELDPVTKSVVWKFEAASEEVGRVSEALSLEARPEAELLSRARSIHWKTLTLDTHKDIAVSLASPELPEDPKLAAAARLSQDPTLWGTNQVDFPKMRAGGLDVAFFIVYVGQGTLDAEGFASAKQVAFSKFDTIERMARRYPDQIEIARSPADVERIRASGKLVACIGMENGYPMGEDLSLIEEFHRRGARYMGITHNRHSQLGDSNTPEDAPIHGGLSDLGRRAIEEMNRVGIMVDISHAGEETTMQAIAHSKAPVIASHSSVDAVLVHGRNLSDRELLALKANGGVIQIVAFATYVKGNEARDAYVAEARKELGMVGGNGATREDREELRMRVRQYDDTHEGATVADMADHIDHAVNLIGIDHVAISSDFDGGGGVAGWNDASETFNVTLELVRRGYDEEAIAKLWSQNTLRVWRAVEDYAQRAAAEDAR
ncbi:MAG: membrane dipeptidase [Candidatus Paceibacteria bacterium]|jgi:membrane dipeptidase